MPEDRQLYNKKKATGGGRIKRPIVWIFLSLVVLFLVYRALWSKQDDARCYIIQELNGQKQTAQVSGTVEGLKPSKDEEGYDIQAIYLKDCSVILTMNASHKKSYHLKKMYLQINQFDNSFPRQQEDDYFMPKKASAVYMKQQQSGSFLGQQDDVQIGNRISCTGRIAEFDTPGDPGQFDQRAYYQQQGIYYRFYASGIRILSDKTALLKQPLYQCQQRIKRTYQELLPSQEAGIISAMILGDKTLLDMDVRSLYQKNGISHLLAISGLHISILGMAFFFLLRQLRIPKIPSTILVIGILFLYGEMIGFSISFSRAVTMLSMMLIAGCIGRTYDRLTALAFSGILIMLKSPLSIYSAGFLLSFGAVLGIELIQPLLTMLWQGDAAAIRESNRKQHQRKKELLANHPKSGALLLALQAGVRKLGQLLCVSLSVQLILTPILLYFYYELPLYGVLINLLVLPLASLLVIYAFIGGIIGCFWQPDGMFILGGAHVILKWYAAVCHFFQRLPGAEQILGKPSIPEIILYYLILGLLLALLYSYFNENGRFYRQRTLTTVLVCLGSLLMLLLVLPDCFYARFPFAGTPALSVNMLDVGQGDGLYLHLPTGEDYTIDGGSSSIDKVGTYRLMPYLKSKGVRRLNGMILTHCDNDHISGAIELLKESRYGIRIKVLYLPDVSTKHEGMYEKLAQLAAENHVQVRYLQRGMTLTKQGLRLVCLHPTADFHDDESVNAESVTLSLQYGKFSCLLTGDLEGSGEEVVTELLKNHRKEYQLPEHYVMLKVAHHGSKYSTMEEFLELTKPEYALISCGRNNRYGHPHRPLLRRLRAEHIPYYTTSEHGAMTMKSDGSRMSLSFYR